MATKEQYEKIIGRKLTDGEWSQIDALHPAAPKSSVPALAQLSTTPHAPGVTAYRMGEAARGLDAAQLARFRDYYLVPQGSDASQGAMETLQYGKTAPTLAGAAPGIAAA